MGTSQFAQWEDGMGITHGDLTAISRFARSMIFDTWAARAQRGEFEQPYYLDQVGALWSLGAAGAAFANPGGGLSVKFLGGPVFQWLPGSSADPAGTDASLAPYFLGASELTTELGAPDVTNPRWDLICVKIDDANGAAATRHFEDAATRAISSQAMHPVRAARITKQVVAGTPAGAPVEPAVPAGYVKLCAVKISPGDTDLSAEVGADIIRDYRMPIGLTVVDVLGLDAVGDFTFWTQDGDSFSRLILNAALKSLAMIPRGPKATAGRLVRVALASRQSGGGAARVASLIRTDLGIGGGATTVLDLSSDLLGASGTENFRAKDLSLTVPPIWINGYPNPFAADTAPEIHHTGGGQNRIALRYTSGGDAAVADYVRFARFWIAG